MNVLTEIKEGLWISLDALHSNKMRSLLTTLGIVIGIVTVTLMGTAIDGLHSAFMRSISGIGGDVLYVTKRSWFIDSHQEWVRTQKRPKITLPQVRALERQALSVRAMAPTVDSFATIKFKNRESSSVQVTGTTEQFLPASGVSLVRGRFMSASEAAGGRPVCVIGWEVATNLFQDDSPLGQKLRLGGVACEVIGVLEKRGSVMGMFSLDNQVIIPIQQFINSFWSDPDCTIQVKVGDLAHVEEAREEVRGAMRKIRRLPPGTPDDFAINQQEQFIAMFNRVAGTIAAVGLFITGLSLFVGGIGIMNIMFVSVAERTREIGVRKAIGAKRRTILIQFLIEAACICLVAGLIGLGIAWGLTFAISQVLPATMSVSIAGLAILVSLVTGLAAGFLPAWRAARLDPVEALRNE